MVLHFHGRYRSAIECKFLEQVEEELTNFWNSCSGNSVLIFPPLSARYRFLIHQLVGADSKLKTVSVGQGRQRRTIVYLASKRAPEKMAQSPSTSQRTFFGRGRGRRPKRPDQALYVPGALRQAKLNQVKQNQDVESSTNATENKEIAKSNEYGNSSAHEEKMDGSSSRSTVDSGVEKITMETDRMSLNTNVQHTETPTLLSETVNERLQCENKEPNTVRENIADNDKGLMVAIAENSNDEAPNIDSDNTTQNEDGPDQQVVRTEESMFSTDDQSLHVAFGLESSNGGSDCSKDVVVNFGISQTLSTRATKDMNSVSEDESLETPAVEKCDVMSEKPLVENIALSRQDPCELNAKADCETATTELPTEGSKSLEAENQSSEDGPSLEQNGNAILVEQNVQTKDKSETQETADCSSGDVASDVKVEQDKSWGNEVMPQHDSLNIELEHNEDLISACNGGFDRKEEQKPTVTHHEEEVIVLELTDNESKVLKEDTIEETKLRTSKVAPTAVCESIENSEESITHTSVERENLEAGCSLLDDISALSVTDEKVSTEEKTEDVPESVENVGELETEQQKTSKKKKVIKKDKSKDSKEDKVKSKDKGEKKKKKEKKSGKEKSSNEEKLDSEMQIKEKKKSKTKEERSAKKQSAGDIDTGKKLTQESCAKSCDGEIDDDDDWEAIFDESGDCLNSEYLEELSRLTGITNPEVHKTQFDYYSFKPKEFELDDEEFGHILEIYNFSSELTTQDLMQALSSFRSKGFDIKWVDDTHALAVFASRHAAQDAMKMCSGPLMKLRPVSEGTAESKKKAHYCFEFLQPYRERPQTSKLLADRLVTGALGMRSKMTREERVKEREKIKEAKSKRQQEKIQKAQIWGD